jgi:S-adenosylmethionine hydrolase
MDSYGRLALAVNLGSAAATYGLSSDRRVRIRRS